MEVHLSTDLANQLKLQSSGFLPFAPVFVDPFFQQKYIDPLHAPHELQSHHHHHSYHHQSHYIISSEPMRKDIISCSLLLQKFRIIIFSIIALITYVKESHQFILAWSELVICESFIPRLVDFFEAFTMSPWLEQC